MRILLTGSAGFIGRKFVEVLSKEHDVYCVDKEHAWDFLNIHDFKDIDLILHQGAISDTTCTDTHEVYKYNVQYSIDLFTKAASLGIPVKYASSASVYGHMCRQTKDHNGKIYNPLNYYALSKLTVDYWVMDNMREFPLIQGFRYFNVYGECEEDKILRNQSSPVSKFIHQAKHNGHVTLFDKSEFTHRDFIYVGDVVDIVMNNKSGSGIYDMGTGTTYTFQQIGEIVAEKYDVPIKYIPFPKHLKNKYQYYSKADCVWNYTFTTIEDYVNEQE